MYYWLFLFALLIFNWYKKKEEEFYLWVAFYLFCAGALLSIINLLFIAEILMRLSLIFWLFGFGLRLREKLTEYYPK